MSLLKRLFSSEPDPREHLRPLYRAIVAEARRPDWYREGGVPDSVTGRFDMVSAVLAVVLVRMEASPEPAAASVLLTELFVEDMDGQLREFGVGDVIVGKRVTRLMGAMGGRLAAYRAGLGGSDAELALAVARNVTLDGGADPGVVARALRSLAARLAQVSDSDLLAGRIAR